MEKSYVKLNISSIPAGLAERVVLELRRREERKEKTRAAMFGTIAFAALAALVPALENVGAAATRSGFSRYASLVFSDWNALAGMWKLFAFSLAETAPLFAMTILAAALFVFIWSAAEAFRYVRAARISFN
jgi:hypothetical protein